MSSLVSVLIAGSVAACAQSPDYAPSIATGSAVIALTQVPSDVQCIEVTAAGSARTETRSFDVSPSDSSAELRLERLPLGLVTFEAAAFEGGCDAVTPDSAPGWLSDPVDATLESGVEARVALRMIRNGRTELSIDFADEELGHGTTCNEVNLALNTSGSGYPNPASESSPGWGGGSYPWDIVDGLVSYTDTWAHGLAFTGGFSSYGEACGDRQATIDFGAEVSLHRALVWHHGDEHVPSTYELQYWTGSQWLAVDGTSTLRTDLRSDTTTWGAVPTEHIFSEVTTSKLRFTLNNCDITHGWLYELEAFGCE